MSLLSDRLYIRFIISNSKANSIGIRHWQIVNVEEKKNYSNIAVTDIHR